MNTAHVGELAALGTSLCWAFSSIFFTVGGRRVGSIIVNRGRLVAAVLLVSVAHLLLLGRLLPAEAGPERWLWFGLSALVGLVLGDTLLFQSYLMVGTRIGMLIMSLNPIFGALLAWLLLGETMQPLELLAMALALGGATWVVMERSAAAPGPARSGQPVPARDGAGGAAVGAGDGRAASALSRAYLVGLLLALGAGLCQALGLIIAKFGLADNFSPLSAVAMRMSVAMSAMWLWALVVGQAGPTIRVLRNDRIADLAIFGGAFAGPFLGVWLSLVAVQSVRVGVASTLMAMTPVLLLPLVHWIYKERITSRAVIGTCLAVAGVAAMFLV